MNTTLTNSLIIPKTKIRSAIESTLKAEQFDPCVIGFRYIAEATEVKFFNPALSIRACLIQLATQYGVSYNTIRVACNKALQVRNEIEGVRAFTLQEVLTLISNTCCTLDWEEDNVG